MLIVALILAASFFGAASEDWGCLGPQPGVGSVCASRAPVPAAARVHEVPAGALAPSWSLEFGVGVARGAAR